MSRRWVWGLAPLVLASMWFVNSGSLESESKARLVPYQPLVSQNPTVAIATGKSDEYGKTTLAAIRTAGGLEGLVKPGCTVFIKPNIVGPSPSGAGRITDYRVVQAVINESRRLGAKRIVVGETPVDCSWDEGFSIAGYDALKGAELMDTNTSKDDSYYMMPERSLIGQPLFVPKIYIDADVVIDVPVMKTHFSAGVTLGLKNVGIGMPPLDIYRKGGNKGVLHDFEIMKEIPDVSSIRRPDFTVVDGMVGGEGMGPTEPTPVQSGLVIAGRDIVAVDTVGTLVMGYNPYNITYLVYAAAASRLGIMDINKINVVGKTIAQVQQNYELPPDYGFPFKRSTVVQEAAAPVKVDGDLADWAGAWANAIADNDQFLGSAWKGQKDLSARTFISHDWKNVYVAYDVTDDAVVTGSASKDYHTPSGDAVELALTFDMPFDQAKLREQRVAGKDFLFVASLAKDGGVSVTDQVTGKAVAGAVAATTKTAAGYTVEMQIPIESLGLTELKLRSELWVDFAVSDVDTAGKGLKTQATWTAPWDSSALNNPSSSGRAIVDAVKHPWAE